jgi:Zn finger protein HypA/HybF involved in hydrogenase expression
MDGQMTLFETAKAPIWHSSLTASYVVCPTCKEVNHIENWHNRCPDCGQLLDQSPEAIAKAEKVSADLKECRKLGLHGAVRKNEKGKWEEVNNGIQNRG